ncbi:MAG: copper chaperone PCu(A)C [Actinobacteria bacterium]|nr:copper chaperone PCu(A)C [Actinomycetota bacterium]
MKTLSKKILKFLLFFIAFLITTEIFAAPDIKINNAWIASTEEGDDMSHEIKIDHDKTFEFKSGGSHLMLMDFKGPLKAGQKVKITLHFKDKKNQPFDKSINAIIK